MTRAERISGIFPACTICKSLLQTENQASCEEKKDKMNNNRDVFLFNNLEFMSNQEQIIK